MPTKPDPTACPLCHGTGREPDQAQMTATAAGILDSADQASKRGSAARVCIEALRALLRDMELPDSPDSPNTMDLCAACCATFGNPCEPNCSAQKARAALAAWDEKNPDPRRDSA